MFYCSLLTCSGKKEKTWGLRRHILGDVSSALGKMGAAPFGFVHCLSRQVPDWTETLGPAWRVCAAFPMNGKYFCDEPWPPSSSCIHHLASTFPSPLSGSIGSTCHRATSIEFSSLFLVTLDMTCNYPFGSLHKWASPVVIFHKIWKWGGPLKIPD